MAYSVRFSASARRHLERIPEKAAVAAVEFSYGDLVESPQRVGKKLGLHLAGNYSARRGPYRIIYSIHEDRQVVVIQAIAHRADVYRK